MSCGFEIKEDLCEMFGHGIEENKILHIYGWLWEELLLDTRLPCFDHINVRMMRVAGLH